MENTPNPDSKIGFVHIIGLFLLTVFLSVSVTLWVVKYHSIPSYNVSNALNPAETAALQQKLKSINMPRLTISKDTSKGISFNEKELNALLTGNTAPNIDNISIKDGHLLIKLKE